MQSLRTLPKELGEATTLHRLSRWQRFPRLELPFAAIPLLWNAMMSFGSGWFFVAASEAISVLNNDYTLPGIGSDAAAAIAAKDLHSLGWAKATMAVVILLVDQLFWRPLVAWSDRFRLELSGSGDAPGRGSTTCSPAPASPACLAPPAAPVFELIDRLLSALLGTVLDQEKESAAPTHDRLFNLALLVLIGGLLAALLHFVFSRVGLAEEAGGFEPGLLTLTRVLLLLVATLIWTPIGVAIGFHPRLARLLPPLVLFLAAFPANCIFPFATLFFIHSHMPIGWGSILLMALGAQ